MHISVFDHTLSKYPIPRQFAGWKAFCAELIGTEHVITTADKKSVPLFSPAEYAPGTTRGNANVVAMHALALDFDKLSDAATDGVIHTLAAAGLEYVLYTTYSHAERFAADGSSSFRVVLPVSRPITPVEWPTFWLAFTTAHNLPCDPSRKDLAGLYALPYAPTDTSATIAITAGEPINVDIVLASSVVKSPNGLGTNTPKVAAVSVKDLRQAITKIAKRAGDKPKLEALLLRKVADGEAYQTPTGGRHEAMLTITTALAREFPSVTADALAGLLTPSHVVMQAEDPSYDPAVRKVDAARAIEGARAHRDAYIADLREKETATKAQLIANARGDGQSHPYTPAELAAICAANGFTAEELPKRWIMRKGSTCYLLTLRGYLGPHMKDEIVTLVRDHLAPAGVEYTKITKEGVKYKSPTELFDEHSTTFDDAIAVMGSDYGRVVKEGPRIVMQEAACYPADITPAYSARAEKYAEMLGSAHVEKFKDWLATCSDLSKATCAIYLEGEKGKGKSAFATMISQLWRSGTPITLGSAVGDFNEELAKNPVITIDETWPASLKANDSGTFRDIVSQTVRKLSRKYLSASTLVGAIRLIMMANSDRLIKFSDLDTQESLDAVAERLLYLRIPNEAENVFTADPTLFEHLVTDRAFAKYCLWLRDNRDVPPSARFHVAGEMSSALINITMASDDNIQACHWVYEVVKNPKLLGTKFAHLFRVEGEHILVNSHAYAGTFETYLSGKAYKIPTLAGAGRALSGLSHAGRVHRMIDGCTTWFYKLPKNDIAKAIESKLGGDAAGFLANLVLLEK